MEARLTEIRNIIKISLNKFTSQNRASFLHNKHIQTSRMDNCNINLANTFFLHVSSQPINKIFIKCKQAINTLLDAWKGVRKSKTEKDSFRKYFKVARNSFDQCKQKVISTEFWSPIFDLISTFAFTASDTFFCSSMTTHLKEYALFLQQLIFKELMIGGLKTPNTRNRWLIASGIYINLQKNNAFISIRMDMAKLAKGQFRAFMVKWMTKQCDKSEHNFVNHLIALHQEVDNYGPNDNVKVTKPNYGNNTNNNDMECCTFYGCEHNANSQFRSKGYRFSPY